MLCPFCLADRDTHGRRDQIVEVVKSSYSILPFYDEVQKCCQTKWLNVNWINSECHSLHIKNCVHTYITKRNVLHLYILQHNYEKFMTSEQMHL